eukprot:1161605-Pelagomonas_calceolata.AAC.9
MPELFLTGVRAHKNLRCYKSRKDSSIREQTACKILAWWALLIHSETFAVAHMTRVQCYEQNTDIARSLLLGTLPSMDAFAKDCVASKEDTSSKSCAKLQVSEQSSFIKQAQHIQHQCVCHNNAKAASNLSTSLNKPINN